MTTIRCRGIRGATTAAANTAEAILASTRELLEEMVRFNEIDEEDVTSIFFTVTDDLDAVHPALAARQMGWVDSALLCAREIPVPDAVARCIRVLLHVNTTKSHTELQHIYLREAIRLRPDFAQKRDGALANSGNGRA